MRENIMNIGVWKMAGDTPVAGHVTVRTAQCATIAALHQPICSPAAAREGHLTSE